MPPPALDEVARLVSVLARLRRDCPWDAEQTHASLVQYLVEETAETIEAIESGNSEHLQEELGDLLLQVVFHAQIAGERDPGCTLYTIAAGIADKLIRRHPYVFGDAGVPEDLNASWEQRKAAEKGRTSALDGIPDQLSALARVHKIISRVRSRAVPVKLPEQPIEAEQLGAELVALVARAHRSGLDPDQVLRAATRELEAAVRAAEQASGEQASIGPAAS